MFLSQQRLSTKLLWVSQGLLLCTLLEGLLPQSGNPQIVPDNTLGTENSIVIGGDRIEIEGGAQRGSHLFHSFTDFNVSELQSVYFANPVGVLDIYSRVTGENPSNIFGVLGIDGNANLFLLNPNGVIFGPDAQLDIAGSLTVSTADRFFLSDGNAFSATDPQPVPNLVLNITPGLQYGTTPQSPIRMAARLSLPDGQQILLLGSEVLHEGQITVPSGNVELLGQRIALLSGSIDVSAAGDSANAGQILIGGDFQGQGPRPSAEAVYIAPTATLTANGVEVGDGGQIGIWSETSTRAYGQFQARGGTTAGDGGLIETSGRQFLDITGARIDATAANGTAGTWLLDPYNVILGYAGTANGSFDGGNPDIFTPTGDDALVDIPTLESQLNAGTNVVITTGSGGTQAGNISANGFGINVASPNQVTLTLQAANDISLANFGINATNNALNLLLEADSDRNGSGSIDISNGGITLNGGQISMRAAEAISLLSLGINNDAAAPAGSRLGDLTFEAESITIEQAGLRSTTNGAGDAGSISLRASQDFTLRGASLDSITASDGNAGPISITANQVNLEGGINSRSLGSGQTGAINIDADTINVNAGGGINSQISDTSDGDARPITITANQINLAGGISTESLGSGQTGAISVDADTITVNAGGGINSKTFGTGTAGPLTVRANIITLQGIGPAGGEGAGISSESHGNQAAADVTIEANRLLINTFSGVGSNTFGSGDGGTVRLDIDELTIVGPNAGIGVDTAGSGDAGNLRVDADQITLLSGGGIGNNAQGGSSGNAGRIDINTRQLSINEGGVGSNAQAGSSGNAGRINIVASDRVSVVNRSGISSESDGTGNAGNISIRTGLLRLDDRSALDTAANAPDSGAGGDISVVVDDLSLTNSSAINSETFSSQDAGLIQVQANNSIYLANNSDIFSNTFSGGNAVGVELSARSVLFENDAGMGSSTNGSGNSGRLSISADSIVFRDRSGISTSTRVNDSDIVTGPLGGTGRGGAISITGGLLEISDRGGITSRSQGTLGGPAGQIQIAVDDLRVQNSAIDTSTDGAATANAGTIDISVSNRLSLTNARISSSTVAEGAAGSINIHSPRQIQLTNSRIATTADQPGGTAGSVEMIGNTLSAVNSAVTASSPSGRAGSVTLNLGNLRLTDSQITAETGLEAEDEGANVNLQGLDLLLLEDRSQISASAFNNATGGNVQLEMPSGFIIAPTMSDSDIIARAFTGRGGAIDINAQGIFGLAERPAIPGNGTNDIDASSEFGESGTIAINDPTVDPSRANVELPADVVNAADLVDRSCQADAGQGQSSLVLTGRGGLPPNPAEIVRSGAAALTDLELDNPVQENNRSTSPTSPTSPTSSTSPTPPIERVVEAHTWHRNESGQVVLKTAQNGSYRMENTTPFSCQESPVDGDSNRGMP